MAEVELDTKVVRRDTAGERDVRQGLVEALKDAPIPDSDLVTALPMFMRRQNLGKLLLLAELYRLALPVHGCVLELGCRWGQNLAVLSMLRGLYEPFNYSRRVVGFDSFAGFPSVDAKDGEDGAVAAGSYAVTEGYEAFLEGVLGLHQADAPIPHVSKHELVKGDACETVPGWVAEHPEAVVAMAVFDFDLYEPTKVCLEALLPRCVKGTVLVFDELNHPQFPGETRALDEVVGLRNVELKRSPLASYVSWCVL